MTDPEDLQNASMLDLFRMEAEAQAGVLNAGLLALERSPTDPAQLEACMRAAHSLKGAARIVDLAAGVRLAHAMEDVMVAAQEGRLLLGAAHIDALLQGTDALLHIADAGSGGGDAIDALVQRLETLPAGSTADPGTEVTASPTAPTETPAPDPAPAAEAQPEAVQAGPVPARALRVSAAHLDAMLDISAKSLVEFQKVGSLRATLDRLKQSQAGAVRLLDAVREALPAAARTQDALALLAETRDAMAESREILQGHLEAFEDFSWTGGRRSREIYDAALASRMRPFADISTGWERMLRDIARDLGKQVRLELLGAATPVDRDVLERLDAPIVHLLRNAVDHGIEAPELRTARGKPAAGLIRVEARHHAGDLVVEISDDGAGIDLDRLRGAVTAHGFAPEEAAAQMSEEELLAFLSLPGFSLRGEVTAVSGRGVGLDAAQHDLRQLRGSLRIAQTRGAGCRFHLQVPLTLSVIRSLVVEVAGEAYAFPLSRIERMLRLQPAEIVYLEGRQQFWQGDRQVGLLSAGQLLQRPAGEVDPAGLPVVLLGEGDGLHGIAVDRFLGERSLVVVPIDPRLGKIRDVAAGAMLDDGRPVLILDVDDLLGSIGKVLAGGSLVRLGSGLPAEAARKRVLVVDDSLTVRELERKLLAGRGYDVSVAVDGVDGWNMLQSEPFDLLVTDIDMPRMDGIELVTRLRANNRLQSMPVMVVSYKDREEDRRRGLEAGADRYLAKAGFHDETLLDAVQSLIGAARE
ncbi:hybrid sensor histidine kinase/response regulator [Marinibaculum pumilum]|uniref:histidine kinase n=1 Tax=Marinibaculum pumilum TaxID=1766165 RepID=A0ABV7L9Q6_9PROT